MAASVFKQLTVGDRQSVIDIAIQEYGCYEGVFTVLRDNGDVLESLHDVPVPGTKLLIRNEVPKLTDSNRAIVQEMRRGRRVVVNGAQPVTHQTDTYIQDEYWDSDYTD